MRRGRFAQMADERFAIAVGHVDPLGAAVAHALQQARPVRVVRDDEAPIVAASTSCAAHLHPSRCESRGRFREATHPGRSRCRGRRHDQLARKILAARRLAHRLRGNHAHAGLAIRLDQTQHRAVQMHGAIGARGKLGQNALGLAERIAEQDGGNSAFGTFIQPGEHLANHRVHRRPAVNRQAEGRLGDEDVAGHGFERDAGRIGIAFVVAGDDSYQVATFDAQLCRAEHVAGRMQRQARVAQGERLAVSVVTDRRGRPQSLAHQPEAGARHVIQLAARPCVVAMGMRNHSTGHGKHGVDEEVARRAIEAFGRGRSRSLSIAAR